MTRRLVVSFIGDTDLNCYRIGGRSPRSEKDRSPLERLLVHLAALNLCTPGQTALLLFDDRPKSTDRAEWMEKLVKLLPEFGIRDLDVRLEPAPLAGGPNDFGSLYDIVFRRLPALGGREADEVIFNVTSGTWAMQSTLVLAACCLPSLRKTRLFESSTQRDVLEVTLPYVLFQRESRRELPGRPRLSPASRKALIPHTVVGDPEVETVFAMLARAAANRAAQTLVIKGPGGSGKWRAAEQFGRWRASCQTETWLTSVLPPYPVPEGSTVLIWRLDAWQARDLDALATWRVQNPNVSVVATWRTDTPAAAPLQEVLRSALPGAAHATLPSLSARTDIVDLGEALAVQLGLMAGKVGQRLQCELAADIYANNLHDLKRALVLTDLNSKGMHPDRRGALRAIEMRNADDREPLLREIFDTIANLRFGPGRPGLTLDGALDLVKQLIMQTALAQGRSQKETGELLGYEQSTISEWVGKRIELSQWRTPLPINGDPDA